MHMSFGHAAAVKPYTDELMAARQQVLDACRRNGLFFLDGAGADDMVDRIDEGVRIISGHSGEEGARIGRAHTGRTMPV